MPGSGRHEIFAARGLVSHPLTPSDYVRVTRVLAAAPLLRPCRTVTIWTHPKISLTGATSTPSTRGIQARLCSTSYYTMIAPHARHRQGLPPSASRSRASARRTPLRLEDETAFSAILRKPMNWLGICRNNAASSIGLSGRPVRFSATMPVRNPSLAAARSNSRVRTATCSHLNRMA